MPALVDLVGLHIERWDTASVELGVFRTSDAGAVAAQLEAFAFRTLGSPVQDALFYGSSSGCVAGLLLADGQRAVVKAYQPRWGYQFLSAVRRVQEHLANAGFPCPRPFAGPASAGVALATVEALVPDPGMRTLTSRQQMSVSARALARQVELCRSLSEPVLAEQHPLRGSDEGLFPQPHNPIFDFSLRQEQARWIDQLAMAAKQARGVDDSPPTVVHADWSARNVRIDDHELCIAYDWDSLTEAPESVAVGQAAATWRSTGEASDPLAPDAEEVHAYVSAYEIASGRVLSQKQRAAALAAALWVLAYTARCEHALEAATGRCVERARARLADQGSAYLL